MNRTLLVLNIVLLATVGVLLALFLGEKKKNGGKTAGHAPPATGSTTPPAENFSIAYFDIDSITNNYQYCKDVKQLLEKRKDEAERKMQTLQRNYESRLAVLQQKTYDSEQDREKARAEVAQMQQNMAVEREKTFNSFEEERKMKELDIKKSIEQFLNSYNTPRKFSYILADEPGIFYFRDSAYNITSQVLNGLNSTYKKQPM